MSDKTYRMGINRIPLIEKPDNSFPWNDYAGAFEVSDVTSLDLLENIGRGFGFSPVFGGDGRPTLQNFREVPYICVDLDTEDERSSLAKLEAHPLVRTHGAIIYPTHSCTLEKPRHRVVFLLDAPLISTVAAGKANRAITSMFPGAEQYGNANKTWMANGKIDADDLWKQVYYSGGFTFPLADLALYVRQWQDREQQTAQRTQQVRPSRSQSIDIPHLSDTLAALNRIDPYSLSYEEWVKLGAAMAHSYGDNAYYGFKQWSDRPGKEPLSLAKWRSFSATGTNVAGYGTISYILKQKGVSNA